MIYKYCRRCGRRLIGAENRLRGYGETCFEKAQREAQGGHPLISPTKQTQSKTQRQGGKATEGTEGKAENLLRENLNAGETPHLEKTLSPTYKKPLLFRPHTDPHPRKL